MGDIFLLERLRAFLAEDTGSGDLTTDGLGDLTMAPAQAVFAAREPGVLAGLDFALEVIHLLDPTLTVAADRMADGDRLTAGSVIARVTGQAGALLRSERTALNLLQRLSGVATETRRFVDALAGSATRLLDTRKTTPGFRWFEKYAVRVGGGRNHRLGLFDGVMLKDNHIAAAGGITEAVRRIRAHAPVTVRIEVEADTLEQVAEAVAAGADIIMLDNMSLDQMAEAVLQVAGRARLEASGRVGLTDLPALARLGLDYVSTSAPVTRARWLDIGLDFTPWEPDRAP